MCKQFSKRLVDIQDHRLSEIDANGMEQKIRALNAPALQAIAAAHFKHEEDLMTQMKHPLLNKHSQEHRALQGALKNFEQNVEEGLIEIGQNIRERLMAWWIEHTNGTDVETFRTFK